MSWLSSRGDTHCAGYTMHTYKRSDGKKFTDVIKGGQVVHSTVGENHDRAFREARTRENRD